MRVFHKLSKTEGRGEAERPGRKRSQDGWMELHGLCSEATSRWFWVPRFSRVSPWGLAQECKGQFEGWVPRMQWTLGTVVERTDDNSLNFWFSEVLQLIKSQKFLNKLVILVETEKEKILRKEYVFADSKVSDNKHVLQDEKGHVS